MIKEGKVLIVIDTFIYPYPKKSYNSGFLRKFDL